MMKKLLLLFLLFPAIYLNAQGVIYYSWDFSNPHSLDEFTLIDSDNLKPNSKVKSYGFTEGTAWIRHTLEEESNNAVIMSTSCYSPKGKASDWLITPQLDITSPKTVLSWKARNMDADMKDGYNVYISTKGNKIEDFDPNPLFSTSAENDEWIERKISLSEYNGQKIYLAFVNLSDDKYILCIDDIQVRQGENYELTITTPERLSFDTSEVTIQGTISPLMGYLLEGYTIHCSVGEQTFSRIYEGLKVKGGHTHEFQFDEKIQLPQPGSTVPFKVWATIEDEIEISKESSVSRALFFPDKLLVLEEGTGTWCSACPAGIVKMKQLKDSPYKDKIIGIAVHAHDDPMAVTGYWDQMNTSYFSGYPEFVVNRRKSTNYTPSKPQNNPIENTMDQMWLEQVPASLRLTAEWSEDSTAIETEITTCFAYDYEQANYRIALILIENGIQGYTQQNIFSGGQAGKMGGFENLPSVVAIDYDDVARAIYDSFWGIKNSIPKKITKDEDMVFRYTASIPETIQHKNKLEMVAILIDMNTKEIVNGNIVKMPDAISALTYDKAFQLSVENGYICIQTSGDGSASEVQIISPDGITKYQTLMKANAEKILIPVKNWKGIHFIKIKKGNSSITKKIIL